MVVWILDYIYTIHYTLGWWVRFPYIVLYLLLIRTSFHKPQGSDRADLSGYEEKVQHT